MKLPPSIKKIKKLKGKHVLLRMALNVPIEGRDVHQNDFRLKAMLPTLKYLINKGAKVVGIGHLGRGSDQKLRPVVRHLNKFLPVGYLPDVDRERSS